jgi:ABC-2 type transport system permease protein
MVMMSQRLLFGMFLMGKVLRFLIFLTFLYFLVAGTGNLAGYTVTQTIFFYLTFNLIDVLGQFLFREVYRFRPLLVSGDFDLVMSKPMNPLFRVLLGGSDVIDLVTIPFLIWAVVFVGLKLDPTILNVILYIVLIVNGLIIATSFHIATLATALRTLEIDHTVMIYRDIINLGKLPVDIYKQPLRTILTFVVPVGIMVTLPARTFLGVSDWLLITSAFIIAGLSLTFAFKFWKYSLRFYTSASS